MPDSRPDRVLGALTFQDVPRALTRTSILCLPLGSMEQHGPHLPLDTDTVIAENVTREIVRRHGEEFDLWQLPAIPFGLSREHGWAAGTVTLNAQGFTGFLRDLMGGLVRSLPARNLAVINGHGGNRGILQALIYEWQDEFGLNPCVIHPLSLSGMERECVSPDIHGGRIETSLMLLFARERVRLETVDTIAANRTDARTIEALVLDPGVTWPWRSDEAGIASLGITGETHEASIAFGQQVLDRMMENVRPALERLRQRAVL